MDITGSLRQFVLGQVTNSHDVTPSHARTHTTTPHHTNAVCGLVTSFID
jgi:hypothetical protein